MSSSNPKTPNNLPSSIQDLTARELFLFTRIPLHLLEGFINGKFKPNKPDREKLTNASVPFYKWNELEKRGFIQRRKYREVRAFISWPEKDDLLNNPEKYEENLNALVDKYWDLIVVAVAEK